MAQRNWTQDELLRNYNGLVFEAAEEIFKAFGIPPDDNFFSLTPNEQQKWLQAVHRGLDRVFAKLGSSLIWNLSQR